VQGSKGSHLLGLQQLAERLGVGGVHRWGVGLIGARLAAWLCHWEVRELDATGVQTNREGKP
jgi:hypothetical protein